MLKHVYHSGSSIGHGTSTRNTRKSSTDTGPDTARGASPAPSTTSSVSTEGSASSSSVSTTSSASSPRSIYSSASTESEESITSAASSSNSNSNSSSFSSWRGLAECRTSSRLSMSENPNALPLRVYAGDLRPDIQYKTVGVTHNTTCEEVITALLAKCKIRFKDPRLFNLAIEVDIRGPNGCDTRASILLEDSALPLQLQECYPKGQARFYLQMKPGSLVKVFDGSSTAGWQYKSIMISDRTTAGELIDILFRYVVKNLFDTKFYTLHIEVEAWKRQLNMDEAVIPAQNTSSQWGTPKLILGCQNGARLSSNLLLGNSTTSLYENVHPRPNTRDRLNSFGLSSTSSPESPRRDWWRGKWRRSKSLSESPTDVISTFPSEQLQLQAQIASSSSALLHLQSRDTFTDSISTFANFSKINSRTGRYELSEAFFV